MLSSGIMVAALVALAVKTARGAVVNKRAEVHTNIHAATGNIDWGNKVPGTTLNEFRQSNCNGGTCFDGSVASDYIVGGHLKHGKVQISVRTAFWDTDEQRDQLFDAAIDIVNTRPEKDMVTFAAYCSSAGNCRYDKEIRYVQTHAVVVQQYDAGGDVHGVLSLKMTNPNFSHSPCKKVLGILGDAAGAISGIGGGVFGIIKEFCDS